MKATRRSWSAVLLSCLLGCSTFGEASGPGPDADAAVALDGGSTDGSAPDGGDGGASDAAAARDASSRGGCAGATIFCDDFEDRANDGDVAGAKWQLLTGAGQAAIVQDVVFSPSRALAISAPEGTAATTVGVELKPVITSTSVTVSAMVRLSGAPNYVQLFSAVANSSFFAFVADNGRFAASYMDGGVVRYVRTSEDVPLDTWFALSLEVRFGPGGGVRFMLDGALLHADDVATTDAPNISYFALVVQPNFGGSVPIASAMTFHYDDIRVE